jgi:polar amino acid transport system substrate-binding protein
MKNIKKWGIIALFVLAAALPAFSQKITSINLVTEEWEDCTNADGSGLYFDIFRAVFEPEGIKVAYQFMPYARSVETVQAKKADAVVGTYKDEVEGAVYPKWHFSADDVSALTLKGGPVKIANEKSLQGKRVAWLRGYDYDDYIDQKMTVTVLDKRENAVNMLLRKRIDVFLDNPWDTTATIEEMKLDMKQFDLKVIKYLDLFLAFSGTEKGRALAKIWDKNIKKLIDSGKLKALFEEYDMASVYHF